MICCLSYLQIARRGPREMLMVGLDLRFLFLALFIFFSSYLMPHCRGWPDCRQDSVQGLFGRHDITHLRHHLNPAVGALAPSP